MKRFVLCKNKDGSKENKTMLKRLGDYTRNLTFRWIILPTRKDGRDSA